MEQNTSVQDIAKGKRLIEGLTELNNLLDSKVIDQERLFSYLKERDSSSRSPFVGNKSKNFTIRLTDQENETLKQVAKSKGLPIADLVRSWIYEGLES